MGKLSLGPFTEGANNVAPDYALPKDQYGRQIAAKAIVNADVLNSGHVRLREGYSLVQAFTGAHSGFSDGTRTLLVRSGVLYLVTNLTTYAETLIKVLSNDNPMSYVTVNGEVYCSNGTDFGRIGVGNTWSEHALPTPATCVVTSAAGALPAGKYQLALTYAKGTTEEGGAKFAEIEVAVASNLTVTLPVGAGGATHINLYMSELNGGVVRYHSQVAVGTASIVVSAVPTGRALQTSFREPLPAGTQLAHFNGRLMSLSGTRAYVSDPFNLGLYDPVKGFIEFPSPLSVMAPNQDGVYFVADKTYWFSGTNPLAAEMVNDVLPYGGTPGTFFTDPENSKVGWYGQEGIVVADPQGQAKPVQEGKYAPDVATNGAVMLREREGLRTVVMALTGTTKNPVARTTSTGSSTYCMNMDTGATSTYESFAFNSFFEPSVSNIYALRSDGIYKIGGALDGTAEIAAYVDMGKQDFKTSALKHIPNAYVGAASATPLQLVVNAAGVEYTYAARSYDEELKQQRFDVGMGLRANWFNLTLQNSAGGDFEIADFTTNAIPTQRRI